MKQQEFRAIPVYSDGRQTPSWMLLCLDEGASALVNEISSVAAIEELPLLRLRRPKRYSALLEDGRRHFCRG
jgi:hypothetical protein